jgi:hypothetical protein
VSAFSVALFIDDAFRIRSPICEAFIWTVGDVLLAGRPSGSASSAAANAVVHHGVIREDAVEGSEVKMDVPLAVTSRKGIRNGTYSFGDEF